MKCYNCDKENIEDSKFCSNCGCTLVMIIDYPLLNNRYKVLEIIGAGGMSTVLKAEDQNLGDSICVIKEMTNNFTTQKERIYAVKKFKDEAFILAKMRHPNVPVVTDYFVENDKYYLVMDYIPGKNLKELLQDQHAKAFPEDTVKNIGIQICAILEYLHGQDRPIIHRDLKPSNFLLEEKTGKVILIDFGIARRFDPEKTGTLIGTPGYMAPEQYTGKVDIRCDIFSLGATLHHLITGEDPADRASFEFSRIQDIKPDVSLHMQNIIRKAISDKPDRRFQSATQFKQALTQKTFLDSPVPAPKESSREARLPRLLPTAIELEKREGISLLTDTKSSKVTNKMSDFKEITLERNIDMPHRRQPSSVTKKASRPTALPSSESVSNVRLHSFQEKENIKKNLESYVGIDIGTSNIKILQMNIDDKYFIYPAKVIVVPVPPGAIDNGVIVEPARIGEILKKVLLDCKVEVKKAIVSIPKSRGFFHNCLVQEMPDIKIKEIVPEMAKKYFPFLKEGAFIDYQPVHTYLPRQDEKIEVVIAGVEDEVISGLRKTLEIAELEVKLIEFQPFLLNQAINIIAGENVMHKGLTVLDIGGEVTSVNIVRDGYLWFSGKCSIGGHDLTRAIASKLNIDIKKAEALKKKHLDLNLTDSSTETEVILSNLAKSMIKNLFNDVMKHIDDFNIKYNISRPFPILFSGGASIVKGLDRYVEKEFSIRSFKFKMPVSQKLDTNKDVVSRIGPSLMVSFALSMARIFRGEETGEKVELKDKKEEKKSIWDILKYKIF